METKKKEILHSSFLETAMMPRETTSAQNASPPELNVTLPLMSDLPETSFTWNNVELPVDILLL